MREWRIAETFVVTGGWQVLSPISLGSTAGTGFEATPACRAVEHQEAGANRDQFIHTENTYKL